MKKNILLLIVGMVLSTASLRAGIEPHEPNPDCDFIYQDICYHITDSVNRTVEIVYLEYPDIFPGHTPSETALLQKPPLPRKVDFNGRDVSIPQEVEHDGVKYTVTAIALWGFTSPSYKNINVLTLPPTIKKIGNQAFILSWAAKKVVLTGKERIEFGTDIFIDASVEELELSDGVEKLHGNALGYNKSTKRVRIGTGLHSIGDNCFGFLCGLEMFELSPENPYLSLHDGVLFNHDKTRLMSAPAGRLQGSFEIPEGTVEMDSCAFFNSHFREIKFPSTLRKICSEAFAQSQCVKAELPEGLEEIENNVFFLSDSLIEVTIPSTIQHIDNKAFSSCYKLKAIHCRRTEPLAVANGTFGGFDFAKCVLYVPVGSTEAYRNAPVWKLFKHIKEETAGVDDIAAPAVQSVKYVNLAGMESDKPFAGLNIVVTTLTDGSRRTAKQRF